MSNFEHSILITAEKPGQAPTPLLIGRAVDELITQVAAEDPQIVERTLLVWADDLAAARAHDFGQRLDGGNRVTARQSVDLEVTESFRALRAAGRGWRGPLWVCVGPEPGPWVSTVDWCLTIERARVGSGTDWRLCLRPCSAERTRPPVELGITGCIARSAVGQDLDEHRRRFRGGGGQGVTGGSGRGRSSWYGADGAASECIEVLWSDVVTSALQEAEIDPTVGVVVLGAAQYSMGSNEPKANEHFGAPRQVRVCVEGSTVDLPLHVLSHACASVLYAVELAQTILADPSVNAVVVAAVSSPSEAAEASMRAVRALSDHVARPFSPDRDGITLGAGAGAIVLQRRRESTVPVLASLVGVATRVSAPTAASQGTEDVADVLHRAHLPLDAEVPDVVVAHATGTSVGDPVELAALVDCFRDAPRPVAVVSHKGATGHLLHASGILGLCHGISVMGSSQIAGTWHLLNGVEQGSIRAIAGGTEGRPAAAHLLKRPVSWVAVNALGFGGNTATVVLSA